MTSTDSALEGVKKLAAVMKPLNDELAKAINEHTTNRIVSSSQEVLLAIQRLESRIEVLERLLSERKKSVRNSDKKSATPAEGGAPADTTGVVQPEGTKKGFPINKLVYFRERFKTSAEFRNKYLDPVIEKEMNENVSINSKTKEEQKLIAQAQYVWNYLKSKKQDTFELIDKEYAAAKQAYEAAIKEPQQTAEAHTPPPERKEN